MTRRLAEACPGPTRRRRRASTRRHARLAAQPAGPGSGREAAQIRRARAISRHARVRWPARLPARTARIVLRAPRIADSALPGTSPGARNGRSAHPARALARVGVRRSSTRAATGFARGLDVRNRACWDAIPSHAARQPLPAPPDPPSRIARARTPAHESGLPACGRTHPRSARPRRAGRGARRSWQRQAAARPCPPDHGAHGDARDRDGPRDQPPAQNGTSSSNGGGSGPSGRAGPAAVAPLPAAFGWPPLGRGERGPITLSAMQVQPSRRSPDRAV